MIRSSPYTMMAFPKTIEKTSGILPRREMSRYPAPKAKFASTQLPNPAYVFLSLQYTVMVNPTTKGSIAETIPMVRTSRIKITSLTSRTRSCGE